MLVELLVEVEEWVLFWRGEVGEVGGWQRDVDWIFANLSAF